MGSKIIEISHSLGQIPLDLLYEGATLYDTWTLNGIGMMSGETIKGKVSLQKTRFLYF